MLLLLQFLLRLAFGLSLGMAMTSSQKVSSGYFRNHLYVVLGFTTLASMVAFQKLPAAWPWAAAAAVGSYVGSVCWLYERPRAGWVMLLLVAGCSLWGAFLAGSTEGTATGLLHGLSIVNSGLVLGTTMAAMLLGHWYLNSPGMELEPLRRLLLVIGAAVLAQMVLSAIGLAYEFGPDNTLSMRWWLFVGLRWSFGLVGVLALVGMAWQTLKIPNTQSATGILYVAVLGTFTGELMALLLSVESRFPL